ncbi:MAG: hypothetical protein OSB21_00245 [Myxococcota bacterium]|nr:hypothetical protein [Myxococcota bacterium]
MKSLVMVFALGFGVMLNGCESFESPRCPPQKLVEAELGAYRQPSGLNPASREALGDDSPRLELLDSTLLITHTASNGAQWLASYDYEIVE